MSGIELARLIKQRKRTRDVPILFLTAHMVDDDDVLSGYGAGAVDYLSKPVNADILRSKIAVFVDLYRKTRELAILNDALNERSPQRQPGAGGARAGQSDLERRVRERTAALTVAHGRARENEERLRLAIEIARRCRLGVEPGVGPGHMVHGSRGALRLPAWDSRRGQAADSGGSSRRSAGSARCHRPCDRRSRLRMRVPGPSAEWLDRLDHRARPRHPGRRRRQRQDGRDQPRRE